MVRTGILFQVLIVAIIFVLGSSALAQIAETDFDQDGRSDFIFVQPAGTGELDWYSINSSTGATTALGRLGKEGNHIVMANWSGSGVPELGVVYFSKGADAIVWDIRDETGAVLQRQFGEKGDLVISGADFNGNGYSDAAVARLIAGKVRWFVALDPFTSANTQLEFSQVGFGSKGARLFYASPDGGNDWLAFSRSRGNRTVVRLRNMLTAEVRTTGRFPAFISKEPRPRAFAVRNPGGVDILAFARARSRGTRLDFFGLNGEAVSSITLAGTGDVVVGNFHESPGEEVALKSSSQLTVFNPFSGLTTYTAAQAGIGVDGININAVGADTPAASPNPGDSDNGNDIPSGPVAACSSVRSWPSSHIYKTIGSEHFTDIRRNTVGIVIKPGGSGPFPSCIALQDTKGRVHAQLGLYARGDGWEARYYAGIGCGASTALNGSAVASRARANTGSSQVYANFGSVCYGPIDASRCIGSAQC